MYCGSGSDGQRAGTVVLVEGLAVLLMLVYEGVRFLLHLDWIGPRPTRAMSVELGIQDSQLTNYPPVSRALGYFSRYQFGPFNIQRCLIKVNYISFPILGQPTVRGIIGRMKLSGLATIETDKLGTEVLHF